MTVIKSKQFPDRTFKTKSELHKALKEKKKDLLEIKMATIKNTDGFDFTPNKVDKNGKLVKDDSGKAVKAVTSFQMKDGRTYHAINTTNYLDSHDDVHLNGIWRKSASEQNGKTFFVADHVLSIMTMIAHKNDVNISVKKMKWEELGRDYEGETEVLMFDIDKSKIKLEAAREMIEDKTEIEHSIRMRYVKIELAINSSSDDYTEEKKVWDDYIDLIVNKEAAIEQGYFFAVSEAKIVREGSMVLFGSNDATPIIGKTETKEEDLDEEEIEDLEEKRKRNNLIRFPFVT